MDTQASRVNLAYLREGRTGKAESDACVYLDCGRAREGTLEATDATITLMRRLINGERVWLAHRSHFYQRATDRGFTVTQVAAHVFAVNLGLAALAVTTAVLRGLVTDIVALICGATLVGWLLYAFAHGRR